MYAQLTSLQLAEVEAYSRVEADPEGEEARVARIAAAQKARFRGFGKQG
jgi:hypothetical protein